MIRTRISGRRASAWLSGLSVAVLVVAGALTFHTTQAQSGPPQGGPPPGAGAAGPGGRGPGGPGGRPQAPPKPFPLTLTVTDGSTASYRVREQLAGIAFPSDAVGTSNALSGQIVFNKDGSLDSSASKLT